MARPPYQDTRSTYVGEVSACTTRFHRRHDCMGKVTPLFVSKATHQFDNKQKKWISQNTSF